MGIGRFFKNPVKVTKDAIRRKKIAVAVGALVAMLTAAGWTVSPRLQEAVTNAINAIWTAVEEAPTPPAEEFDPVEQDQ